MIKIRQAHTKDSIRVAKLFDSYRQFYGQISNSEEAEIFIRERLEKEESVIFICEEETGEFSGFVQMYPIFTSVGMKRSWLLNDLYVSIEFRQKGIAGKLIERCKQHAKETAAAGLLLETSMNNAEANSLYLKLGFELQQSVNYYFWKNSK